MSVPSALEVFLQTYQDVQYFHHHWVNYTGYLCERILTRSRCLHLASTGTPVKIGPLALLGLCPIRASDTFHANGWDSLSPDWSSLRYISPQHASVICALSEENVRDVDQPLEDPFARCARSTLRRVIEYGHRYHGITFLAGFEIEFYLLDEQECSNFPDVKRHGAFYLDAAVSMRGTPGRCVETCVQNLEAAGIGVDQFKAEGGLYQFEISMDPLAPCAAVDALVQSQEIIRRTATTFKYKACYLPRPFPEIDTSGLHMNLSLHVSNKANDDVVPDNYFVAGILKRLPALCAISLPSEQSYHRVRSMATGTWVAWGTGNHDTPIRKTSDHWEFRTLDATANPYLAVAAYISAGLLGIEAREDLKWRDYRDYLSDLTAEGRVKFGIDERLPRSVGESAEKYEELARDDRFCNIMGRQSIELFKTVHRGAHEVLSGMSNEEAGKLMLNLY